MYEIRPEIPVEDLPRIRRISKRAFVKSGDSGVYEHTRYHADALSLVALHDELLIAHILFTPTRLESPSGDVDGMGLLLLAVDPDFQRRGIGSQLALAGIDALKAKSCPFVIVIGIAEYYPRFGFRPGSTYGLKCQWPNIGDESFMALILDEAMMTGKSGTARYIDEFG